MQLSVCTVRITVQALSVRITQAYINAMKHPAVKILGHCDDTHFPVDYETLAKTALQENVIFEINEASLAPYGYRGDTRLNTARILYYCRKYNIPIILSSDSHGKEHIGDFTYSAGFVIRQCFRKRLSSIIRFLN